MIRLGQYHYGNSFVHCLDAQIKILSTVVLSIIILQAQGWNLLLPTLFLGLFCRFSRLKFSAVQEALKPLVCFAVLLFGLHLFFTDGDALWQIPGLPVRITEEGFFRGLFVSWQFLALVLSGVILTVTTSPADLVGGLEHLLSPLQRLRIPVQDIAVMVSMALRFVPTFLEEYHRIKTAQRARCGHWGTKYWWREGKLDLRKKLKTTALLLVSLLIGAFRRAEDLAKAMEARGYAQGQRTTLYQTHFGCEEAVALGVLGVFVILFYLSG